MTEASTTAHALATDIALADFVTVHYQRLFRLAMLVSRDPSDAADAVQFALERAWRNRATLRQDTSLRSWLDRIVVNEAIRQSNKRRSWIARFTSSKAQVGWIEPVDERAAASSEWSSLRAAFDKLPAEQRAAVVLHMYAGYSLEETAELVSAPVETVRSRLRLAKDRLRRELGETK
jgi:RNA polymerase sigma-70 factor (ECF subfamily)